MFLPKNLIAVLLMIVAATEGVAAKKRDDIFLIRHGEKPKDDEAIGLSEAGIARSDCIRNLFVPPAYNIGYIMAQTPKANGRRSRPMLTVMPLAEKIGLEVDISCDRDDKKCVRKAIDKFQERKENKGKGVLISWEHDALSEIAEELDVDKVKGYPSDRFDLIWHIQNGKIEIEKQKCPGLDD